MDPAGAKAFYGELFGWEAEDIQVGDAGAYTMAPGIPRLRELGGGMLAGLLDLPAGRIAVVHDPQGAVFALFEGETDD
jgi:predicted enzyme related to lactoylglutathione lyase